MDIEHVVVLMLENRSFDCILGALYPGREDFDGLTGAETNAWHKPGEPQQIVKVWKSHELTAQAACIPDPDPGESFDDIHTQIHGTTAGGPPSMGGFVDDYMRQPPADKPFDPAAVMHYFTPEQLPVMSTLARQFGVSDRWFASAPCQTWPNRFFVHTATARGYVNNSPTHFPYDMDTVYDRLAEAGHDWRIYFHDIPQTVTLSHLWPAAFSRFLRFDEHFAADAAAGRLPAYSFIEPRYFTETLIGKMPNDQHPPHNVGFGEQLVASVYNAVRSGPGWNKTLLIITYDEHGGCYDHVIPPPATSPGGQMPDHFDFGYFGVRVPAIIVSPYVKPGSVLRPAGVTPYDHTSIIATLGKLFGLAPLTPRDAAAPDLLDQLTPSPDNQGPASLAALPVAESAALVAQAAALPVNDFQRALHIAAAQLPTGGANIAAHVQRQSLVPDTVPLQKSVGDSAAEIAAHMDAFLQPPN